METGLAQIATLENLFELSEATTSIVLDGEKLKLSWLNGYKSPYTDYESRYVLILNRILLVASRGTPSPLDIKNAALELEKIHSRLGLNNIDVVWDIRQIQNQTIKVRRQVIRLNKNLAKYWGNRYLILSPKYKTLVKIYKFIYQPNVENLLFSDSVGSALNTILMGSADNAKQKPTQGILNLDRNALLSKDKEELVNIIERYNKSHKESTDKVLEAIGHISWEGKFKKIEIEVNEADPHFELVNAFSLLQQDVAEIIKEYQELNLNLELKVAERIVDFIDKESNLRAILDNSDRVTWLLNTRYELIDFNMAFADEVKRRYKKTPKINQSIFELLSHEEEIEIWKNRIDAALEGKPGVYLDQNQFDGYDQVWEIKTFPIKEIEKIKGVSVFIEDITELKESQFRLIAKNRDLQKVNSELDSFVYRVSHDLRAPLTSILGLIGLIKIETNKEKVSEYIELQEKSINKLDLFIKEIINLSRNSRLGITVSKIDFQELLDEVFENQAFTKTEQNFKRIFNIEDELSFYTDRQRLTIILNNLISNSLKYANSYEKEPYVKVNIYTEDNNCVIEVSDNGIGISEAYLPKIFEMFFRATQEFSGSGLGLYIVKETVEKLKGKISVKSKTREGTTFRVVLPNFKDRYDAAPKLDE